MKKARFCCAVLLAAGSLFFASCGGGEKKENKETGTETVTPPAPVNTIVTTTQNMVVIIHKVDDYTKWEAAFEQHDSARLANGLHKYVIGRGHTDSNMVMVALKSDDIAKAKAFSQNADLKKVMQNAGVTGPPEMHFVTTSWQDTANVGDLPRVLTTFEVKDHDAWFKAFEEGKQERMDNGIVMRIVGNDADDNKKIKLVSALSDTAKAFAYYKSDAMKKRMENGGLTSQPKRFVFHVVKRY